MAGDGARIDACQNLAPDATLTAAMANLTLHPAETRRRRHTNRTAKPTSAQAAVDRMVRLIRSFGPDFQASFCRTICEELERHPVRRLPG